MHRLANRYHPITGTPFQADETYREYAPCDALKPYIRCFWGTEKPVCPSNVQPETGIVIPDTCMDVIFDMNFTQNTFTSVFCGMDETSLITKAQKEKEETATFGIRFYAWTAVLFSDGNMAGTGNKQMACEAFCERIEQVIKPYVYDFTTINDLIEAAENVLFQILNTSKADHNALNAIDRMIATCGRERIRDVCEYASVSARSLERSFEQMMGISPKAFSSLLRYQMVWQEMTKNRCFQLLDAVEKYGYTDQAHLLHDFKKRHLMTPSDALRFAKERR